TDAEAGLSTDEAHRRLEEYGPNRIDTAQRTSPWKILLRQFANIIMVFLAIAAVLSLAFGHYLDGFAILTLMLINTGIGFTTELQSARSLESLSEMDTREAAVIRDGERRQVPAQEVVPGDICILDEGDVAPADLRLFESEGLEIDESSLTGESLSVEKQTSEVPADTPLGDRTNMVYKGTGIQKGDGVGVVVATGMDTEVGTITRLATEAEGGSDPLTRQLDALTSLLIKAIIAVSIVVGIVGVLGGKDVMVMLETTIALIVAAVPEGLPVVATLALTRGMYRMARRNALVRRLAAVQTLGSTTVILTDKTGTLTENQMAVRRYYFPGAEEGSREIEFDRENDHEAEDASGLVSRALTIGALCTEGPSEEEPGEPMEQALLEAASVAGKSKAHLFEEAPRIREIPFDPDLALMASIHEGPSGAFAAVKGSPEAVLDIAATYATGDDAESGKNIDDEVRRQVEDRNRALAADGMRVLALAVRDLGAADDARDISQEELYRDLRLIGLVAFEDPPREGVAATIETFRRAGVRTVMVTGDQEETATAIGRQIGLLRKDSTVLRGEDLDQVEEAEDRRRVVAADAIVRLSPEEKLTLIELHQEEGDIVAMTGDGVNDAPALRKADIGVAMGGKGEAVAREAADLVLTDDRFETIATAIEYGRIIFDNIRRFSIYLTSGNVAEILIVAGATVVGAPVPLLPLQILYLNVINDVFPALALGLGGGHEGIMTEPPRDPQEGVLESSHLTAILAWGALIAGAVLGAFFWVHGTTGDKDLAVSVSFLGIGFARLWHVINMRSSRSRLWRNQVIANPFVWGALLLCTALFVLAAFWEPLAGILQVAPLGPREWAVIGVASVVPAIIGQLVIGVIGLRRRGH
ncbi:MAG: cation-translocating P-type ATPase, partial [Alkalispirochaeta sp.]